MSTIIKTLNEIAPAFVDIPEDIQPPYIALASLPSGEFGDAAQYIAANLYVRTTSQAELKQWEQKTRDVIPRGGRVCKDGAEVVWLNRSDPFIQYTRAVDGVKHLVIGLQADFLTS